MDPDTRQLLRAAAVFGERFWPGGVEHLRGGPTQGAITMERRLADLEDLEVISSTPQSRFAGEREYVFRHALVRDAAYDMLTDEDRRLGHALAGAWLERHLDDAALLAHHFELGEQSSVAAKWHVRAAEDALAANDFDGLVVHVTKAESQGAAGDLLGRAFLARAEASYWRNDAVSAARDAHSAFGLVDRGSEKWFAAAGLAVAASGRLDDHEALRTVVAELEQVPARDERTGRARAIARARAWPSQLVSAGDIARADTMLDGCEAEPGAAGDVGVQAWLCNAAIDRRYQTGQFVHPSLPLRAIELYESVGDRRSAIAQAGMYVLALDSIGETELACTEAARLVQTAGDLAVGTLVFAQRMVDASLARRRGDLEPTRIACDWVVTTLSPRAASSNRVYLALMLLIAGRIDEAASHLEATREASAKVPAYHSLSLSLEARIAAFRGDGARAVELAERALAESARGIAGRGATSIDLARVVAFEAAGRPADMRRALEHGLARLRQRAGECGASRETFLAHGFDNATLLELARTHGVS